MHGEVSGYPHRVMFLLSALAVGGSERKIVRVANALSRKGWEVTVAYLNAPHTLRDEISEDVDVAFFDRKGKFGIGALKRLVSYISSQKIKSVYCINLYPLIYAYLARHSLLVPRFNILATINTTNFLRRKEEWKMLLYAPIMRRADKVIFGSHYQQNLWVRKYGLDRVECSCIYNGVDLEYFDKSLISKSGISVRDDLGIPAGSIVVGSIGRFRREKQYELVIRACVEVRKRSGIDVRCVLVGGGPEEGRLRKQISDLQCEEYVFLVDSVEDVRPYLHAMDIFVLSSKSETFSNAALEAMAMGLPVVLPRVGGCPEMVKEGETGFIYDPGDISQLVDALFRLGESKEHRQMLGEAARKYIEESFHFDSMIDSYARSLR